ncbi:MAG: acyl-CoA/acyl-ACP dehydrogenase [Chloroflexi bacterium]|nr:acyl-CoA/acyl-ACP dehydrogenase [Chloroflexota bacterium]MCI0828488.1 acyl-CoA/acyl-ACP dehydrogenase [Chloroflexota bacterium]MCI0849108.1 acyl-CoA/acyl-ACP dehydrogenase [Chloroflexota bacterium]MCI0899113.1 acyl-CoA/acyl-ACP dehydrogenase [Chloroflexota bacterium]MCI0901630.1 acyl-CoA/acyl-ACP dehydrogenase [Chloroflexota bacterium]
MDILPSEEEQMLKNLAREFLEAEISTAMVREMELDELGYPPALWKQMADLGWLGMALPEQYGGQGLPLTYLGLILEEAGRVLAPVPLYSTMVAALTIAAEGNEQQKQEILPAVSDGGMVLTWAVTERDPRLIPEAMQLQATADGDGWVLNGTKMFVDNFIVAQRCLVACRTSPASDANQGITLFLVDPNGTGVSQTALLTLAKDKQSRVDFQDHRIERAALVGEVDQGWPIIEAMLDRATALLCCQMVGAARKDAEMAIEYAKNRIAFGRPIGAFQSVQHMLADMIIHVDGGQMLTFEALWKMDQGLPASVEVSQAKAFCNEKCESVVRTSQVIHGGIGFMMEFDLHLWFRRVTSWTMRLGTTYDHRARIAAALLDVPGKVRLGMPLPTAV